MFALGCVCVWWLGGDSSIIFLDSSEVTPKPSVLLPLVFLVTDGLGVRRDYKMAIKFFNLASNTGIFVLIFKVPLY